MQKRFVIIGSIFFCSAIIFGAFGAHALKEFISEGKINSFEVGVRYQMFQSLAIIILSLNSKAFTFKIDNILRLMILGLVLFSFSIYLLTTSEILNIPIKFIGPITPIGGFLLVISWVIFIIRLIKD